MQLAAQRRPSASLRVPPTRALAVKLAGLIDLLRGSLHRAWDTTDDDRLVVKIEAMARTLARAKQA